jgi:replicative DNA helicase
MNNLTDNVQLSENKELEDVQDLVIAYLINNPDEIVDVSQILPSSTFRQSEKYVIYSSLVAMAKDEIPIDLTQLTIYLDSHDLLVKAGGIMGVTMLAEGSVINPSPTKKSFDKAVEYLGTIDKRSTLANMLPKLRRDLLDLSKPFDDVTAKSIQALEQFLNNDRPDSSGLSVMGTTIHDTLGIILSQCEDQENGISPIAMSTGFVDLDAHMGGWQRGDFVVIGATPGMGKSAFAVSTCLSIAKAGHPVAFFSLEMTTAQMQTRCLSMTSGVSSSKIRDRKLTPEEKDKLISAAASLSDLSYWGTDKFSSSIDFVISESRKLAAKHGKIGAIAVDYIQLLVQESANSINEISDITRRLKSLAIELDCTIFGLSQLNRAVAARNDKRPVKSDLRSCGSIEQDSDIVLMLYRDETVNPNSMDKGVAEIGIVKFRNGQEGVVKLAFDGATTQFKNLAKRWN